MKVWREGSGEKGHRPLPPKAAAGGKLSLRSRGHECVALRGAMHRFCGGMAEPQPPPPHRASKAAVSEHHTRGRQPPAPESHSSCCIEPRRTHTGQPGLPGGRSQPSRERPSKWTRDTPALWVE